MTKEFKNFDNTVQELLKVPHSVIKARLEEEKAAKKRKNIGKKEPHDTKRAYCFTLGYSLHRNSLL